MHWLYSNNFIKGVGSGYLLMLVNNLVGLWLIPFSLKYLTREEFSIYYIATDLILWLGLVNLGTSSVFVTRVAQVLGRAGDGSKEVLTLVNTGFFAQCFFAVMVCLLGLGASFFLPLFFETVPISTDLQFTFIILSFSLGITMVGQVFSGLLVASKQIHIDNLIQVLLIIPRITLTVTLLRAGYGILALAFVNLFVSLLGILVPYLRVVKRLSNIRISFRLFDRKLIPDFLGNGIWFSIGGIAGILILNMDRYVIGNFVGLALVSNFIITQKMYDIANKIVGQVVNVSRPYLAGLFGRREIDSMRAVYTSLFIFTLLLSSLMGTLIFIVNKHFISIWVGDNFYAGDEINLFLALNFILQVSILPNRVIGATTLYKLRLHSFIRLAEGLTNLFGSILLAKSFGVLGVVMASVLTTALFSNIALTYLTQQFFRSNQAGINQKMNLIYIIVGFPILCFALNRVTHIGSFVMYVFITVTIALIIYFKRNEFTFFIFLRKNF